MRTWIWRFTDSTVYGNTRNGEADFWQDPGKDALWPLGGIKPGLASEELFCHDIMRDRARSLQSCTCISDDALIWHEGPRFGEFSHVRLDR